MGGVARPAQPAAWWATDGCAAAARAASRATTAANKRKKKKKGSEEEEQEEGEVSVDAAAAATPPGGGTFGCGGAWVLKGFTAVSLAGGHSHLTAVDARGDVWVYGSNEDGQLGDGGVEGRDAPPRLARLNGGKLSAAGAGAADARAVGAGTRAAAAAVGAGGGVSLAITPGGDLFAWGKNNAGQIAPWGGHMRKYHADPILVAGPSKPTVYAFIAAGGAMMAYEGTTLVGYGPLYSRRIPSNPNSA